VNTISIVIVAYNRVGFTLACLCALRETLARIEQPYEVILIDNASSDQTPSLERELNWDALTYIRNAQNVGFAKANNQGAQIASGDVLVLLNNVGVPPRGWLDPLVSKLANANDAGAVGARLLYPCSTLGLLLIR